MNRCVAIFLASAAAVLTSCGGGSPSTTTPIINTPIPKYLYVANSGEPSISAFTIAANGQLTPVSGNPLATTIGTPGGIVASSSALYLSSAATTTIIAYRIDPPTGHLTAIDTAPIPAQPLVTVYGSNLELCGGRLYSFGEYKSTHSAFDGFGAEIFPLNGDVFAPSGAQGFGSGVTLPIVTNGTLDSSCKYSFYADTGGNSVAQVTHDFAASATYGYIPAFAGTAPVAVAADATSKFVYAANSGSDNISAYSTDVATGTLTPVAGSPFPAGHQPSYVAVVQNWVFVANAGDNTISAFTRDTTTGVLTPVVGSPFQAGTGPSVIYAVPTALSGSPSGELLYVSNRGSNNISAFLIDTQGALHAVAGSPYSTGNAPKFITAFLPPQ